MPLIGDDQDDVRDFGLGEGPRPAFCLSLMSRLGRGAGGERRGPQVDGVFGFAFVTDPGWAG